MLIIRFFFIFILLESFGRFQVSVAQQTFARTFTGQNSDGVSAMTETNDGNYILIGYSNSFGIDSMDICLTKIDSNGNVFWTKTFGTSNNDYSSSITLLDDGGFLIGGSTQYSIAGGTDIYLIRTDSSGNLLWDR